MVGNLSFVFPVSGVFDPPSCEGIPVGPRHESASHMHQAAHHNQAVAQQEPLAKARGTFLPDESASTRASTAPAVVFPIEQMAILLETEEPYKRGPVFFSHGNQPKLSWIAMDTGLAKVHCQMESCRRALSSWLPSKTIQKGGSRTAEKGWILNLQSAAPMPMA